MHIRDDNTVQCSSLTKGWMWMMKIRSYRNGWPMWRRWSISAWISSASCLWTSYPPTWCLCWWRMQYGMRRNRAIIYMYQKRGVNASCWAIYNIASTTTASNTTHMSWCNYLAIFTHSTLTITACIQTFRFYQMKATCARSMSMVSERGSPLYTFTLIMLFL